TVNPHVSLANWWFQPLTQTSFPYYICFSNAMQSYYLFSELPNFPAETFAYLQDLASLPDFLGTFTALRE
uniref:hypothetical protein n=1 Tax=Alloprevotella sp. TaxID=1872471 RepID=UPI004025725C